MDFDKKYYKQNEFLKTLDVNNLPNLILYSYETFGKKEFLDRLNISKKKKVINTININNKDIEFTQYISKDFHEVDLLEIKQYKNIFLKNFIKSVSSKYTLKNNSVKNNIIIHNIDYLTKEEQFILRKIIEDKTATCSFILTANSLNNLINPILSRCTCIKFEGFTDEEIDIIIKDKSISRKKKLKSIIQKNKNNIYNSFLDYENFLKYDKIYKTTEEYIEQELKQIINFINKKNVKITNYNKKKLDKNIHRLYNDFSLSYEDILKKIFYYFIKENKNLEEEIINLLLEYGFKITNTSKGLIHIESFIIELKYLFKNQV